MQVHPFEKEERAKLTHTYTQVICCQVSICLVKLLRSRWSTKIDGEHKINMSSCTFTFGLSVNNASQHWLNPWQLVFNRHMQAICARWIVPNGKAASFQQKNQWWETMNKYESPPLSLCLLSAENYEVHWAFCAFCEFHYTICNVKEVILNALKPH